jgi:hypothetical protein
VRCVPATANHQAGDLTYWLDLLMNVQFPGIGAAFQLRASFAKARHSVDNCPIFWSRRLTIRLRSLRSPPSAP